MGDKCSKMLCVGSVRVRCRMSVFCILHSLRSSCVWRKNSKAIIHDLEHTVYLLCYIKIDHCSLFVSLIGSVGFSHRRRDSIHHLEAVYEQDSDIPPKITNRPISLHPADVVLLSSALILTHWEIRANHKCLNCSNAQINPVPHCLATENYFKFLWNIWQVSYVKRNVCKSLEV